jgi:TonB-linked SusC/RagA family outer membrane protein
MFLNTTPKLMMMKKLYKQLSLTACMLFVFTSVMLAQERSVSGTVTDETGAGMPGVNVIVKGTATGTTSDVNGKFGITVPDDQAVLVFTFVGYATSEVTVGNKTIVDIQMATDVQTLTELVVTGYQVQRKADISGAVAVVNSSELQTLVASSFAQKLAGRAPGVTISTSGAPGDATNVRIRGISSFGNNDPLYVIDGVPVEDKGNLNINPNDIESMQVLKDPSTASIYGSRAANGVVVITTKKGKAGKTTVTYNGSLSFANSVKGWDDIVITNSNEYVDMTRQFFGNGGQAVPKYAEGSLPTYIYVNPDFVDGTNSVTNTVDEGTYDRYTNPIMRTSPGTNWWDETTRTGTVQDHYLSVQGGNETAVFAVGAGALIQEGVLKFNDFKRYNIRANSSYKIGQKVRIGQTLNFATRNRVNNPAQSEQGVLSNIYKISPLVPVYDIGTSVDDEGYRDSFGGSKTANTGNANNPYATLFRGRRNNRIDNNLIGNFYGEADLFKGLTFRTDFKYDYTNFNGKQFTYRTPENQENQGAQNFRENWGNVFVWTWTNTLNYSTTLAENHKVNVLLGYEALEGQFRNINGGLNNYFNTDPGIWYINTAYGDASTRQIDSNGGENSLLSFFGKVDYSFADKYYISATVRRDGSSRFSEANRYATFPAVSIAWRLSGESFLANSGFITDLKLRASWGKTGNQNIVNYNTVDRWGGSVGSGFYDMQGSNGSATTGYHLTNVGTETLGQNTKWEEASTVNFGLDASLLDDKLSVVLDVYQRKTEDLLYNAELPGTFGYLAPNAPFRNTASMTNTGWDLGLGYKGQITGDLRFNVDLNLSHYKNEIDRIDGITTFFYPNALQGRIDNRLPTQININQVGHSISSFRGYRLDGIYRTQEELDALDQPGAQIGGLRFKDLNDDGAITDADLDIIGNPHPDLTAGLMLGAGYKNFEFSAFFVGSFGNDIFNYTKLFTHFRQFFSNVSREYYQENGTGGEPKLNILDTSSRQASEYYVEDGSYVRLGQLQIAYKVPVPSGLKNTLSGLKVYVQGQNLFTITKYDGLDPALSNANIGDFNMNVQGNFLNDLWTGFDIGQYPSNRLFTFGVSAQF